MPGGSGIGGSVRERGAARERWCFLLSYRVQTDTEKADERAPPRFRVRMVDSNFLFCVSGERFAGRVLNALCPNSSRTHVIPDTSTASSVRGYACGAHGVMHESRERV